MRKFQILVLILSSLTTQVLSESRNNDTEYIVIIPFEKIGNNFPNQSLEEIILNDLGSSNNLKVSTSGIFGGKKINFDVFSYKDYVVYAAECNILPSSRDEIRSEFSPEERTMNLQDAIWSTSKVPISGI